MGAIPDLEPLFAVVAEARGIDFRDHRRENIWRGVSTRLEARRFHSVARYAEGVRADRAELAMLLAEADTERRGVVGPVLAPPDAVVATFDLILFRNVLIHFDRRLQENAFARVESALPADGAMFLGRYEGPPSEFRERFPPWGGCNAEAHISWRADL